MDAPLRVLCATWNLGNAEPPSNLSPWIPLNGAGCDIIAVGLQECLYTHTNLSGEERDVDAAEIEHLSNSGRTLADLHNSVHGKPNALLTGAEQLATALRESLGFFSLPMEGCPAFDLITRHVGPEFECAASALLWQTGLLVFTRRGRVSADSVHTAHFATGVLGIGANKGAVVARVRIAPGGMSLVFVASHLAANMGFAAHRNLSVSWITEGVRLPFAWWGGSEAGGGLPDLDLDAQDAHCFWMGDLNYRIDIDSKGTDSKERAEYVANMLPLLNMPPPPQLTEADQLTKARQAGAVFCGFSEHPILHPPTFKVLRGEAASRAEGGASSTYKLCRVPSWCDRVLWKSLPAHAPALACREYCDCPTLHTSDHKPVRALFDLSRGPALPPPPAPSPPSPTRVGPALCIALSGVRLQGQPGSDWAVPGHNVFLQLSCERRFAGEALPRSKTALVEEEGGEGGVQLPAAAAAAASAAATAFASAALTLLGLEDQSDDDECAAPAAAAAASSAKAPSTPSSSASASASASAPPLWAGGEDFDEMCLMGIASPQELAGCHLFIELRCDLGLLGSVRMGQAVLALEKLSGRVEGELVDFEAVLTKASRHIGGISGTLQYNLLTEPVCAAALAGPSSPEDVVPTVPTAVPTQKLNLRQHKESTGSPCCCSIA